MGARRMGWDHNEGRKNKTHHWYVIARSLVTDWDICAHTVNESVATPTKTAVRSRELTAFAIRDSQSSSSVVCQDSNIICQSTNVYA